MDSIDRRILDRIQSDFPLEDRPFRKLGEEIGLPEEELLKRIRMLKEEGYIRRIASVLNSRKVGMKGTLVAMKVPEERLEEVADVVSSYREVSHNYERDHEYNLWFTISAGSMERIEEILGQIEEETDIEEVINLPSEKVFKIGVSPFRSKNEA